MSIFTRFYIAFHLGAKGNPSEFLLELCILSAGSSKRRWSTMCSTTPVTVTLFCPLLRDIQGDLILLAQVVLSSLIPYFPTQTGQRSQVQIFCLLPPLPIHIAL